jgi:hypothetical protein
MQDIAKKIIFQFEGVASNRVRFFVLIGPLFLIGSLFIAAFNKSIVNYDLWAVVAMGLLVCWKYRFNGFYIAGAVLFLSVFIKHIVISSHHMWQFGLESSIAIGLYITAVSFEEIIAMIEGFEKNRNNLLQNITQIEEAFCKEEGMHVAQNRSLNEKIDALQTEVDNKKEKLIELEKLVDVIKHSNETDVFERQVLAEESLDKTRKIAKLQRLLEGKDISTVSHEDISSDDLMRILKKREAILSLEEGDKLNNDITNLKENIAALTKEIEEEKDSGRKKYDALVAAQEKDRTLIEEKCNRLVQDKAMLSSIIEDKVKEIDAYQKKLQNHIHSDTKNTPYSNDDMLKKYERKLAEARRVEFLYKQLKEQFSQKDDVLHSARASIFDLQEQLLYIQKDNEFSEIEISDEEEILMNRIVDLEEELCVIEKENESLETLVAAHYNIEKQSN